MATRVSSVTHQRRVLVASDYFVSAFRPEVTDTRQTQSATKATWNDFQAPHTSPTGSVDSFRTRRPRNGLDGGRHSPANVSCAAAEARFDNATVVANETFKQTSNSGANSSLRSSRALSGATSEALGTEEDKHPGLR